EGRDLVHLGLRQAHFLRQRREVRGREVAEMVLQPVQVLDQQVGAPWRVTEQLPHFGQRLVCGLAALGTLALALPNGERSGRGDRDDAVTGHLAPLTSAGQRRGPTGTWRRALPPAVRWSRHRRGCRSRTGTGRLPRLPRRR